MSLSLLDAANLSLDTPFSIQLEAIRLEHATDLARLTEQNELWRNSHVGIPHPNSTEAYIQEASNPANATNSRTFVVRWDGQLIGSVRLFLYAPAHRRVQLGGAWVASKYEGTGVTRACGLLIMTLVFETLNCQRLEFTTHPENHLSRNMLTRLGATYEGTMRKHLWVGNRATGHARDSALYSLTDDDWPECKRNLLVLVEKLAIRHGQRHSGCESTPA